jgi:exosome complex component CSL4
MQVIPGTAINVQGAQDDFGLGEGVYRLNDQLYASRVGTVKVIKVSPEEGDKTSSTSTVMVLPTPPSVPQVGQTVLGTVTRLASKYVGIDIRVVERPLPERSIYYEEPFKGTIRAQDIWPLDDKDAPTGQLYLAYRPGDLVRARIIGVGDASAGFLLSTGIEDSLGVVYAKAAASGRPLVAVSWNQMMCPLTGSKEFRKTAKPSASSDVETK